MPRNQSVKRETNGNGSIRKIKQNINGKEYVYWQGRYTSGYDPGTGKQIQRSITGKTQKEVAQRIKELTLEIEHGTYIEPNKIQLGQWLDIWLNDYMGDKKYLTVRNYRSNVNTHIKPAIGAIRLSQLTPVHIQHFYNDLLESGLKVPLRDKKGQIVRKDGKTVTVAAPMSPKTVRNIHGTLTKALSVAVSVDYIRSNPADRVTLPRVERKELQPLTDDDVKHFLSASEHDPLGNILKLILFTGLRECEALGLTWDCIDFKKGQIKVCKQLQKRPIQDGGTVFASTKNGKVRVLQPASFVMDLLKAQWSLQSEQRIMAGSAWAGWQSPEERKSALCFTMPLGKPISPTSIRFHFKKIAEEIGIPDARVHDLRHTYAVLSLQNGDDVKTVQGNLGHATAAFTLDVYGHVSEQMKQSSAERMEEYIRKIQSS